MAQREHEVVALEPGGAEAVRALVQMGSGKLTLRGGAAGLMEATFDYRDPVWRPEVGYEVSDGLGHLRVKPPDLGPAVLESPDYEWDLALSDEIPLELTLRLGSGNASVRLGGTRLTALETTGGSGRLEADLAHARDLKDVSLTAGSGRVGLILQGDYDALSQVAVRNASGISELALGGTYPALEHLTVSGASGRISLGLSGDCPVLERLSLDLASGMIDLDLSGSLPEAVQVGIHCVSGTVTVTIPADRGVAVRFTSVSGKITAPDFHREKDLLLNAAYRESGTGVRLNVSTVSGELILQPSTS